MERPIFYLDIKKNINKLKQLVAYKHNTSDACSHK